MSSSGLRLDPALVAGALAAAAPAVVGAQVDTAVAAKVPPAVDAAIAGGQVLVRDGATGRVAEADLPVRLGVDPLAATIDARVPDAVPAATTSVAGKVQLANGSITAAGTDTQRAVTPAGLKGVTDTLRGRSLALTTFLGS